MELDSASRLRDRKFGLLIVGTAFLVGLAISLWSRRATTPEMSEAPAPPTTQGVVGYPHRVDPRATLDAARSVTRRADLRGIVAWGVKSDGTVDVSMPGHRIRYSFSSARGQGPQPPRPPGTLPRREYCGKQNVHVKSDGMVADPDQPAASCLPQTGEPLPVPRCGPKEVWQSAIQHGAPAEQSASIQYFRAAAGPAWRFEIAGTRSLVLYGDCERELTGADATGSVP